jgi:hypothetical protein
MFVLLVVLGGYLFGTCEPSRCPSPKIDVVDEDGKWTTVADRVQGATGGEMHVLGHGGHAHPFSHDVDGDLLVAQADADHATTPVLGGHFDAETG